MVTEKKSATVCRAIEDDVPRILIGVRDASESSGQRQVYAFACRTLWVPAHFRNRNESRAARADQRCLSAPQRIGGSQFRTPRNDARRKLHGEIFIQRMLVAQLVLAREQSKRIELRNVRIILLGRSRERGGNGHRRAHQHQVRGVFHGANLNETTATHCGMFVVYGNPPDSKW